MGIEKLHRQIAVPGMHRLQDLPVVAPVIGIVHQGEERQPQFPDEHVERTGEPGTTRRRDHGPVEAQVRIELRDGAAAGPAPDLHRLPCHNRVLERSQRRIVDDDPAQGLQFHNPTQPEHITHVGPGEHANPGTAVGILADQAGDGQVAQRFTYRVPTDPVAARQLELTQWRSTGQCPREDVDPHSGGDPLRGTGDLGSGKSVERHARRVVQDDGSVAQYPQIVRQEVRNSTTTPDHSPGPEGPGYADGIVIKLSKCGGIREAHRMVHAARALGLQVMVGCMIESQLGISPAAQLAPLVDHVDLDGHLLITDSPFVGLGLAGGRLLLSGTPGLGVTPAPASAPAPTGEVPS